MPTPSVDHIKRTMYILRR